MTKKVYISLVFILLVIIGTLLILNSGKSNKSVPIKPKGVYVAMGDSVAAGIGLKNYSDASACNRTYDAYPNLVAKRINLKLIFIACSGATVTQGIIGSQNVNDLIVKSQLSNLFAQKKPSLITLTIGANDINWTQLLSKCYTSSCGDQTDITNLTNALSILSTNLNNIFSLIKNHYINNIPPLTLTGYYQLLPNELVVNCSEMAGLNAAKIAWTRSVSNQLNATLESAATNYSFVKFAAVNFQNHELCSSNSWIQDLSSSAPYHPSQNGQKAIAGVIK